MKFFQKGLNNLYVLQNKGLEMNIQTFTLLLKSKK